MAKTARLLKSWRKKLGLSGAEAAKKIATKAVRCSQSQICMIERGLQRPMPKLEARIQKVCAQS